MNNREIIRELAKQPNSFWMLPLVLFIMYLIVYRYYPDLGGQVQYLFVMVGFLSYSSFYNAVCLAKEIVRLEEKIEELERRIP